MISKINAIINIFLHVLTGEDPFWRRNSSAEWQKKPSLLSSFFPYTHPTQNILQKKYQIHTRVKCYTTIIFSS
jgi:hypothetical protein